MRTARRRLRLPATGHVDVAGFPEFLRRHLGPSRGNLKLLAKDLGLLFEAPHVTLVNSGSSANLAAALALASRAGKRRHAVASGFTFPTTLSALLLAGFSVTLADTEEGGFGIDPAALERALRPDTGVVCVTHFLGFPARIDEVASVAAARGLLVLQDGCETMGLLVDGRPVHGRGTLTTWSFYHPHHLPAYGGGAVLSPDADWRRLVESIVHWGRSCTCHADGLPCGVPDGPAHAFTYERRGLNVEMSELNACFARWQLETWREQEARRQANYALLSAALADLPDLAAVTTWPAPHGSGSPFAFPVSLDGRDARPVAARLRHRGVEARTLMGGAAADQPAFRDLPHDSLARCRALAASSFLVGTHQTLPAADVKEVGAILREELTA